MWIRKRKSDAIKRYFVVSLFSFSVLVVIHVFTSAIQFCKFGARMVQLSVRLIKDRVLMYECGKRFCLQDEQNESEDRALRNAKVKYG